jgi:hypothetical protein
MPLTAARKIAAIPFLSNPIPAVGPHLPRPDPIQLRLAKIASNLLVPVPKRSLHLPEQESAQNQLKPPTKNPLRYKADKNPPALRKEKKLQHY